jgi:hypothetical protein
MLHFLQSQQGLNITAILAPIIIIVAFIIFARRQENKKKIFVLDAPQEYNLWMASDYYMFINSLILASKSLEELQKTMPLIDGFFDKTFRVPIHHRERKRYYIRLLDSYCKKENELTYQPVELCKN